MLERLIDFDTPQRVIIQRRLFDNGIILLETNDCPIETSDQMRERIANQRLEWFSRMTTYTEREIYDSDCGVIAKRKVRFNNETPYSQKSVINEIRASFALAQIIDQTKTKESKIDGILNEVILSVEKPLGAIIDLSNKSRFTLFQKTDWIPGKMLDAIELPLESSHYYDHYDFTLWCAIADNLDIVKDVAKGRGLLMNDFGSHQTMYKHDIENRTLCIQIIDADRNEFASASQ